MFTRLLLNRMVEMVSVNRSITVSAARAFLSPLSAFLFMRLRLAWAMAISDPEKNAESARNSSSERYKIT